MWPNDSTGEVRKSLTKGITRKYHGDVLLTVPQADNDKDIKRIIKARLS